MGLYEKLRYMDRRYIFILIALSVIIPLIFKPQFEDRPSPIVMAIYDKIENLPPGGKVMLAFDYGPDTAPELDPMAMAIIRHCSTIGHRVYILSLWPEGVGQIKKVTDAAYSEFQALEYGTDYMNIGYKAGGVGAINTMVANFKTLVPADANGTPIEDLPMMSDIKKLEDFDVIISLTAGDPGLKEWVLFAGDVADVPIMGGGTAVVAPELYPYYPQQLLGLMGGLKGAAEYEAALIDGYPQFRDTIMDATIRMGPQVVTHIVIILLIILGNVMYFIERKRGHR